MASTGSSFDADNAGTIPDNYTNYCRYYSNLKQYFQKLNQ